MLLFTLKKKRLSTPFCKPTKIRISNARLRQLILDTGRLADLGRMAMRQQR